MSLLRKCLNWINAAVETPPPPVANLSDEAAKRERAILHAKDGYKNAQEIIRFIDTKSTFFAGSSILLLGFTLQVIKQYFELPASMQEQLKTAADNHPYCFCMINGFVVLSLLLGILCIWSCIFSLVGRPPLRNMEHINTILFPFFRGAPEERNVCRKVGDGMTDVDVAKEYECQLWNVGMILQRKVRRNRWAAWTLLAQIVSLTIGGILLLFSLQY